MGGRYSFNSHHAFTMCQALCLEIQNTTSKVSSCLMLTFLSKMFQDAKSPRARTAKLGLKIAFAANYVKI